MKKKMVLWGVGIGSGLAVLMGAYSQKQYDLASLIRERVSTHSHETTEMDLRPESRSVRVHRVGSTTSDVSNYTGVIEARHETDHAFRVAGKIVKRDIEVGDRVTKGDIIAELDPIDYELAVKLAEADVEASRADASNFAKEEVRYVQLAKSNSTSQSEVDRVQDGKRAAEARLDRAIRALRLAANRHEYCVLKAEANGVVVRVTGEVGEVVTEGRPIVRIAQTDEMEAVIHLPENRASIVKGDSARATVWAESQSDYKVSLRELSPIADVATRTYRARFTIHNPGSDITLGRTITLQLGSQTQEVKLEVPLTSIYQHEGQPAVWRVNDDRLVATPLTIDRYRANSAIVSHGLSSGDLIVACGVQKLDANVQVQVWGDK